MIAEYNDLLDGKEAPMITQIFNELNLPLYIKKAYQKMLNEFIRKFFTIESVELISEYLLATPNAGKLISEYFATEEGMFSNDEFMVSTLLNELELVQGLDLKFFKKIDKLIMQPTMKSVVEDVIQVIYTPL